ncbi:MAG: alpha/beta hydrolase [Deltaproteobacteria bacterium]|nr:alpha/beta hydrolase [Deltaproteobacteria bacterium]
MQAIDIRGCTIAYLDSPRRSGPALLFLHGAGSTGMAWQAQWDFFKPLAHVIIPDLPGHGGSSCGGRGSIEDYAAAVADFIAVLCSGPAIVVGHSMGGAIAQTVALMHPEMVRGLVLIGTGARLRVAGQIFATIEADYGQYLDLACGFSVSDTADQSVRSALRKMLSKTGQSVAYNDFKACDGFDIMDRVASITARTLIISGDRDMMTPLKYAHYLHDRIPRSELHVVPGAGHMVMIEKPDDVNAAIKGFLDDKL